MKKKDGKIAVFFNVHITSSHVVSAFSILDELVEAVPGVVVFMLGQVVVKGLVYGFDVGLYGMTDDI